MVRNRILGLEVVKLLIGIEQMKPAANTVFARSRRVVDLGVILEAGAVAIAKSLSVAVVADRKYTEGSSAVDAGADTQAIGAVRFVDGLRVGSVRACVYALRIFRSLVAGSDDLELFVQAQVLKARVEAHAAGGRKFC